jgi:hypothetical protein
MDYHDKVTEYNKDPRLHCPRCGNRLRTVYVHGHTQCFECDQVVDDCCQGEMCDADEITQTKT